MINYENMMTTMDKSSDQYLNTLVIAEYDKVCRLAGTSEDEDDYYFVFDTGTQLVHMSCLIRWFPLKGKMDDESYEELVRVWNLSNDVKAV